MFGRTVLQFLALLPLAFAVTGCNRAKAKPPVPVNYVRPVDQARADLFHVAKKVEEPAAFEQIEFYVKSFEDPSKGWKLYDLDEYIQNGNYSTHTRSAYDNYRKLKVLEAKR